MIELTLMQKAAVWLIPVLLAITLHEAAHAWMASRCGDQTAKLLGRLSLNPFKHIDLIGTIIVPLLMGLLTHFQFVFGWAKPVPIDWRNLRHPRRDMGLVAVSGPAINLIMALLWAILFKLSLMWGPQRFNTALFLALTAQAGILINLLLAIINLLPIPPLDGSRIVASFLNPRHANLYLRLEPYGFFILIGLLLTGLLGWLITPAIQYSLKLLTYLFNI